MSAQATVSPATQTNDELKAVIADLQRKLANKAPSDGIKLGSKGNVCVYGVGRYPVSLYASQWAVIIEKVKSGKLEAFIAANKAKLSVKE
jgi:hypothetical protein